MAGVKDLIAALDGIVAPRVGATTSKGDKYGSSGRRVDRAVPFASIYTAGSGLALHFLPFALTLLIDLTQQGNLMTRVAHALKRA